MSTKTIKTTPKSTKTTKTQAKTEAPPKVAAKTTKTESLSEDFGFNEGPHPGEWAPEDGPPCEPPKEEEMGLTLMEVITSMAPKEGRAAWMVYWMEKFAFKATSPAAGRLTGPTRLYGEVTTRLQKAGYRVRRQSGMTGSWLYISR